MHATRNQMDLVLGKVGLERKSASTRILDGVLGFFGIQRKHPGRTYYSGAAFNRLTMDWIMSAVSMDKELQADLGRTRARSRELSRNNDYFARYLRLNEVNVVGPRGFALQAHIPSKNQPDKEDIGANRVITRAWTAWSRKGKCTVDGRLSLVEVCRLFQRTMELDGECFIRLVRGFDNPWGFALQFIDALQVDLNHNVARTPGQNEIRMGVEVDAWNKPVAYWVWTSDPSEAAMGRKRERIPASDMIHGYMALRENQTRGLPACHTCMFALHMLGAYMEAEVVAARTSAAKMGWFISKTDEPLADDSERPTRMEATPGLIDALPPGYDFKPWDPQHPTTGFGEFLRACLRTVASGLGVSYAALSSDLSDVNYSSIRVGRLDERDTWELKQQHLIETLLRPVFEAWLDMALLTGAVNLPASGKDRWLNVDFQARGWQWVDPLKEVQANKEAVAAGFKNLTDVLSEQGRDLEQHFRQRRKELDLAASFNLTFDTLVDPTKTAALLANDEKETILAAA
jgi:lambda family phage portal protein